LKTALGLLDSMDAMDAMDDTQVHERVLRV
jgi:hypothetical protein